MKQINSQSLRANAGFTLVELMFVVAIVAVLAALGTTSYRRAVEATRVDNHGKRVARILNEARMEALISQTPVVFMITGKYAIAATGTDLNNDGRLDWVDTNGSGIPDPQPDSGFREGELQRVIDYDVIERSTVSFIVGSSVGPYQTGCYEFVGGASCASVDQIVFMPDGFVYTGAALQTPRVSTLATFTLGVQRNALGDIEKNDYALVRVGAGGIVERYDAQ